MSSVQWMQQCFKLAELGISDVSPNPMVGCVIVFENRIIGQGYHQKFGEAHAEVNAILDVYRNFPNDADIILQGSTVYVNLEPCAHHGKTPPCADLLIQKKVKKVVIANTDPFSEVNGKGINKLISAGIEVETGILKEAGKYLNRRFFTRLSRQRPYIILKWAQTADGYFAPIQQQQKWITGEKAKQLNFKWRSQEDAILVGKNTVLIDNPQLTSRLQNTKNPIRVVIDRNLDIPESYHIFNNESTTIILNEKINKTENSTKWVSMEDMNFYLPEKIAYQLYLMDIQSLIVEGGLKLLNQFINSGLYDEIRIIESESNWGEGQKAPDIADLPIHIIENSVLGDDKLSIFIKD